MGKGLGNMVDVVMPQNRSQQACFELIAPYAVERYPGENGNFQNCFGAGGASFVESHLRVCPSTSLSMYEFFFYYLKQLLKRTFKQSI